MSNQRLTFGSETVPLAIRSGRTVPLGALLSLGVKPKPLYTRPDPASCQPWISRLWNGAVHENAIVNACGMSQSARPRSQRRQWTFCNPFDPPLEIPADCEASSMVLL